MDLRGAARLCLHVHRVHRPGRAGVPARLDLAGGGFRQVWDECGRTLFPPFENAPWSLPRLLDLLQHLWIPVIVIGLGGTASLIRVMRANLLDELHTPYVT